MYLVCRYRDPQLGPRTLPSPGNLHELTEVLPEDAIFSLSEGVVRVSLGGSSGEQQQQQQAQAIELGVAAVYVVAT